MFEMLLRVWSWPIVSLRFCEFHDRHQYHADRNKDPFGFNVRCSEFLQTCRVQFSQIQFEGFLGTEGIVQI